MSARCIILASFPSLAKNYLNWWKFDEVLTQTILHSFFETRCILLIKVAHKTFNFAYLPCSTLRYNDSSKITSDNCVTQVDSSIFSSCASKATNTFVLSNTAWMHYNKSVQKFNK